MQQNELNKEEERLLMEAPLLSGLSVRHPKTIVLLMVLVTAVLAALAAAPTLWPGTFAGVLPPLRVDTDPENMLSADEPVRIFHKEMKKELALNDMVVLGVVNDEDPDGVFNPTSLARIYELTEYAKTLHWPSSEQKGEVVGVIERDIIAPSTVDNIEQAGPGTVRFEWLMPKPPQTREEALAVRDKAQRIPFLNGTLVSEDGKAICIYLPLTAKDLSYETASKLREKIATFKGPERYLITGLPVAEDTFGVEMFKQMAISAPLAMLVVFLLMLFFFRKLVLVISPMLIAIASVICTMGLLIVTGQTVHIMSSMIPIFIMPIAVLNSVHILSEFFDRYQQTGDRRKAISQVMKTLFTPMLYTSLTTMAGFASLALTPIPPVQVFGLFVAFGVATAWLFTVTFVPAYVMLIPQKSLENFGLQVGHEQESDQTPMARSLRWLGKLTYSAAVPIVVLAGVAAVLAVWGISRIVINDNPTKWFTKSHPIRVADEVLNRHFGGTYMAYLAFEAKVNDRVTEAYLKDLATRMERRGREAVKEVPKAPVVLETLSTELTRLVGELREDAPKADLFKALDVFIKGRSDAAQEARNWDEADAWEEASLFVASERQRDEVFKDPEALRYIESFQEHLLTTKVVGKSNSLTDIVKTVYRELMGGDETSAASSLIEKVVSPESKPRSNFRVPDSPEAVAQCLITYQNSHRPQDLWHFVTPDYHKSSIWVQLKSGDNRDMSRVVEAADKYWKDHPPTAALKKPQWFGLTYINVVWQQKMVVGMLQAFLGSFLVVLLMMIVLFGSGIWAILSMIPLTVTVGMIYGAIGFAGKAYDMPVAILSSMTLGLAVDYAIHFLVRGRRGRIKMGSWKQAVPVVFGEPARAITRNVIVIGVGFLPLLAAPLVPYKTVGIFMAAILLLAGVVSLMILPALVRLLENVLFPTTRVCCLTCMGGTCVLSAVAAIGLVAVNTHQFFKVGWTPLTWVSALVLPVLLAGCALMSHRQRCKNALSEKEAER